jgi:lipopolysaccharide export system protein LptA/lipopolysaccharide export system protein LptC
VRTISAVRRRHAIPPTVSAAIQQQSQTFSYNGMEENRTIFTIRASRATRFKEGNQAVLEDVWITIYGRAGDRNDNIHTRECSYDQRSGSVQCKGEVTIDIQGANAATGAPLQQSLQVKTSNLTFNGQTGEASTPAVVEFSLPQGTGRGVGVSYSTQAALVRLEHAIEFNMAPSERSGGLPLRVKGSSLEIRRNDRTVILSGPVLIQQGERELVADKVSIALDENFHARHALAEGHPTIRQTQGNGTFTVSAAKFEGFLSPEGWVERIAASGSVMGSRQTAVGSDRFSSQRVEFSLEPTHNVLRDMTANGGVTAQMQQKDVSQVLKTPALRVRFGAGKQPDQQRIETAETLGPATIDSRSAEENTQLRAPKFTAEFTQGGRLAHLVGATGVEVRRQTGNSAPQVSTAQFLSVSFSPDGQWDTVEEKRDVNFQQGDRHASASYARIDRADDKIALTGSPVLSDAMSRTAAGTVRITQKSGQIAAEGGVVSTYLPAAEGNSVSLGSGPAHISAEELSGSTSSGRVVYSGHARLWQGESVLECDRITLWRDEKKMQATGNVVAVFPQTSGPGLKPASETKGPSSAFWQIHAPELTYWNDQNKARLEGGVKADSGRASLESRTLDVYFGAQASPSSTTAKSPTGGGQLRLAVAQGNVVVRQGDRRGTADHAEYTVADGKFVLSGGQPTITDAFGNTTTGRSLTFFVANDTILIDSREGSRSLTRHRVEK